MFEDKSMIETMNAMFPGVKLNCLDIKVQLNTGGGGCFPMHFDTTQQVSERQITGTLYLNPTWKKGDGGELRVYPFPYHYVRIYRWKPKLYVARCRTCKRSLSFVL
jgi:Rps23 Pro-64 3,4-dihydroxylase Tpa1-like proline 4-hydroxylase